MALGIFLNRFGNLPVKAKLPRVNKKFNFEQLQFLHFLIIIKKNFRLFNFKIQTKLVNRF